MYPQILILGRKVRARIWQVAFGEDGIWKDEVAALSGMTVQDGADAEILCQAEAASNEAFVDVEMRIANEEDARAIAFRLLANLAEAVGAGSGIFDHQMVGDGLDGLLWDVWKIWLDVAEAASNHLRSLLIDERAVEDDWAAVCLFCQIHQRRADEVFLESCGRLLLLEHSVPSLNLDFFFRFLGHLAKVWGLAGRLGWGSSLLFQIWAKVWMEAVPDDVFGGGEFFTRTKNQWFFREIKRWTQDATGDSVIFKRRGMHDEQHLVFLLHGRSCYQLVGECSGVLDAGRWREDQEVGFLSGIRIQDEMGKPCVFRMLLTVWLVIADEQDGLAVCGVDESQDGATRVDLGIRELLGNRYGGRQRIGCFFRLHFGW